MDESSAGRRGVVLPEPLYELLMEHKVQQDREHAGTEWHEGSWMFAQENGRPIDPCRDGRDWKALLDPRGRSGRSSARCAPHSSAPAGHRVEDRRVLLEVQLRP